GSPRRAFWSAARVSVLRHHLGQADLVERFSVDRRNRGVCLARTGVAARNGIAGSLVRASFRRTLVRHLDWSTGRLARVGGYSSEQEPSREELVGRIDYCANREHKQRQA